VILCDTGALVALLNAGDSAHARCVQAAAHLPPEPLNFADASIVAAAEVLGIKTLFSLDSDFHIYRLYGREPFTIVPE